MPKVVKALSAQVADVLEGVLLHQRQRWGTLLGHQRGYEGWWKAECAAALENWCWRQGPVTYGVLPEAKPVDFGLSLERPVDLLVAPWDDEARELKPAGGPRVWIELKERGTWWGNGPAKAFGTGNHGLLSDLAKLSSEKWAADESALACQIVSHVGTQAETIDPGWLKALESYSTPQHKLVRHTRAVGFPLPGAAREVFSETRRTRPVLWASMFIYEVVGRR